jgi:diaminohydroxyphosphoribosylaminopyrimidine deaminase / 5-amino-6-(5-phosphoribosylamino)uracil reductase
MIPHSFYMQRCIALAAIAAGYTAPNPMVGAVLVHNDRIIGEGYHQFYGQAHAEVNCIREAELNDSGLIRESSLYVSLEPCAHFGKTPPCADLIISKKIPKVYVGCRDPFEQVNGKGIEKLQAAGIHVTTGILEADCKQLNKRFFTFHTGKLPYIILKWAETADGKIAGNDGNRLLISNPISNRLVHKWRAEEASILVGTETASADNPSLTTRQWKGKNPVRLIIDIDLKLPHDLHIFDGSVPTIIFNTKKDAEEGLTRYVLVRRDQSLPRQMMEALFNLDIQSVLVEGGRKTLQSFIDENYWDEARIIRNNKLVVGNGLAAPMLTGAVLNAQYPLGSDTISFYARSSTKSS